MNSGRHRTSPDFGGTGRGKGGKVEGKKFGRVGETEGRRGGQTGKKANLGRDRIIFHTKLVKKGGAGEKGSKSRGKLAPVWFKNKLGKW